MKTLKLIPLYLVCINPVMAVQVQLLFSAINSVGPISGVSTESQITNVQLTRGSELTAVADFPDWYDSGNWSASTSFPGISSGSYLSFSFTVHPDYEWTPYYFAIAYQDAGSADSARRLQLRYSGDNFASVLFQDTLISSFPNTIDVNVVDLSALPVQTGTVEFRLYGFGALSPAGLLGLTNVSMLEHGGFPHAAVIDGELVLIPEPAVTVLVVALAGLITVGYQQRRRRRLG